MMDTGIARPDSVRHTGRWCPIAGIKGISEELQVPGVPLRARHSCVRPLSMLASTPAHPTAHCTVTKWLEARAWAEVAGCEHGQMNQ